MSTQPYGISEYPNTDEVLAPPRPEVGVLPGVFRYLTTRDRVHPTEKPIQLLEDVVRICPPDGIVLDPFSGSGSTGAACLRSGRRFIGLEMTQHYADQARALLRAETVHSTRSMVSSGQPTLFGDV